MKKDTSTQGAANEAATQPQPQARREERPCHLYELFVTERGDVYPCCLSRRDPKLRIGRVTDQTITGKISTFEPRSCTCSQYSLRSAEPSDQKAYAFLNLEMSLACQGSCAMCCVDAPNYKGPQDVGHLLELEHLIEWASPSGEILMQGGEILIQPRTMEWLEGLKSSKPHLKLALVTNGNVPVKMVERVEKIFSRVTVSFVGVQRETYKKIMGMEVEKSMEFAETLVGRKHLPVYLKYLITPSNVHESNLFFRWAIPLAPEMIQLVDSGIDSYIRFDTHDQYWTKILARTGRTLRDELTFHSEQLAASLVTKILIDNISLQRFEITDSFLTGIGLRDVVLEYPT